jgi:hypothetical protein
LESKEICLNLAKTANNTINPIIEVTIVSRRIPHGVKSKIRPIRGIMAIESPIETENRSMCSISFFFGKKTNIRR